MFSGGRTKKLAGEHLNRYFLKTAFFDLKNSLFTPILKIRFSLTLQHIV
jgi:hypothetical protein